MKTAIKLLTLVWFVVLFVTDGAFSYSKIIRKQWTTDEIGSGTWQFKWKDQWGGLNYQCDPDIYSHCNIWSWRADYCLEGISTPDSCPQNNTIGYGENLSRTEAIKNGKTVPESTQFTFNITELYN